MTSFRLSKGGLIDRSKPVGFSFDGKPQSGFAGDTLASALIANGQHLMARSFKYHRPRGVISAGSSEPNALVELREGGRKEANTRATMVELFEGLTAKSQNRWPSLEFDVMSVTSLASFMFVAGFYYKTFMWPKSFWEKIYEPLIRRSAGLGRASHEGDPDTYEKAYAHCDLLVIGAGPSGLMAALAAARSGARVILADEQFKLGGSLLFENEEIDGKPGREWAGSVIAELTSLPNVTLMRRTTVFGWYDGNVFGAVERVNDHVAVPPPFQPRQRYWRIFAAKAVLAAGAEERPLVFGGNDVPGVMLASAMRHYANRFAVSAGRSIAVFGNNSSISRTVADMKAHGVNIAAVLDPKSARIVDIKGGKGVRAIKLSDGHTLPCDAVAMSGGWSPVVNLMCHRGAKPVWNEKLAAFTPPDVGAQFVAIGAAKGSMLLSEALREGAAAGTLKGRFSAAPKCNDSAYEITPFWWVAESTGKAFVDYQNDATAKDIGLASREGYKDIELTKRYTTTGMATDQGKLGNVNAIALLAEATGKSIAQVGTTTFRPFYTPVSFGALAGASVGHHFQPVRKTPLHEWAAELGAEFVETGLWMRSSWFPKVGEDWLAAASREVLATRAGVGICDVSTLGKIDIQGKDAGAFLDRLYCNTFSTLSVGKARYGLMLREDGIVFDDGTTSRLAEDHFLMTTTTANAARVMSNIEFAHQALWPELDVTYTSVTEQWAQVAVAGPKSRATLQKIVDRIELNDETVPYLAAKEINVLGGIPARLFRISFSGEHAYELAVPADYGNMLGRALMHAGAEFGAVPYGIEALSIMRVEKGHVAGGELNGTTTAGDLGLGKMMSQKKDYIGRMMATREGLVAADRQSIVGIRAADGSTRLRAGAHLLTLGTSPSMAADQGYITSVAWSPMLGQWVGLALLSCGRTRIGETVQVFDGLRNLPMKAVICEPMHFDPENARLHA
ncbi:sarcosine oxidase subunit alpha family protein [Aestuariivirga litoralis]|uniref:sarcosine oxidase subunit alpha family protein n=1 Tax=Aestuariivirga litoralis TaxID=2650924 RepID=UPI0018C5B4CF|nr:sarcosine oxidase subunit alpha family protein [Aestuariivirga litoralis]MBG1232304.1 sarcosine oxidase subunit alpha family protein [Aestuariivirga litoralis]